MVTTTPTISAPRRTNGVAGQFSLSVDVTYPSGTVAKAVFVGNTFGGPIVCIMPSGRQVFVSDAVLDRIGRTLDAAWIERFYGITT